MNKLCYLKSHLVSLHLQETNQMRKENLAHLIYCLDELILGKKRITETEILKDFEVYSDYMLEIKMAYYILKGYLEQKEKI